MKRRPLKKDVFFYYLCIRKGCQTVWAEIIPCEPDTDNAVVGKYRKSFSLLSLIRNEYK